MPGLRTDRVRFVALMHSKEGMSPEESSRYWREDHSKVFTSIPIAQKNLLKYEQFHFNGTVNAELRPKGDSASLTPYFGMAIFEAESYEKLLEVFQDPEYLGRVRDDEDKFFDRNLSELVAGGLVTVIDKQ